MIFRAIYKLIYFLAEIINGNPPFDKLRQDNLDIADQIGVDLTDLEKMLKQLNGK